MKIKPSPVLDLWAIQGCIMQDQCPITPQLSKPEEANEVKMRVTFVRAINPSALGMLINNAV